MALNLAYSFSRIQAADCPRRFKKLYLDKAYEPSTVPAETGGMVHEAMKYYLGWLYKNKRVSNPEILAQSVVRCIFEKDEYKKWPHDMSQEDRDEVSHKAQELVKDTSFSIDPNARKHWIEQKIVFDKDWKVLPAKAWFNKTGVYFRAILDWAYIPMNEDTLYVIDHKSGWGEPDPGQLPYYAWSGFAGLGVHKVAKRIGIKFHWVAQNDKIEDMGFFEIADLKDIRERIDSRIIEIESMTEFPSVAGPSCSYCGFSGDCPSVDLSWVEVVDKKAPAPSFVLDTMEKAEKGLELLILAKARLRELEEALGTFYRDHGPIKAAGKIFESRVKTAWMLMDHYGIQKALKDLGVHPTDILKYTGLSKTKLWNILTENKLKRHYGDLTKLYGEENSEDQEPRAYVAEKEVKR